MASVSSGTLNYEVDDELLKDFFYDTIIKEVPISLMYYLEQLTVESRQKLSNYIVHRLAEVDPNYVGTDIPGWIGFEEGGF